MSALQKIHAEKSTRGDSESLCTKFYVIEAMFSK